VAERCKARVCSRELAGISGSNTAGGMDVCLLCVLSSTGASAIGRSLVQTSPTDCGYTNGCD
jgi:hypothetical protein